MMLRVVLGDYRKQIQRPQLLKIVLTAPFTSAFPFVCIECASRQMNKLDFRLCEEEELRFHTTECKVFLDPHRDALCCLEHLGSRADGDVEAPVFIT